MLPAVQPAALEALGEQYLQVLVGEGRYSQAAALCPRVLLLALRWHVSSSWMGDTFQETAVKSFCHSCVAQQLLRHTFELSQLFFLFSEHWR